MRKGELTKGAILDEAVQIASQVGFAGLSIGQLADEVEMSKSGLFAHFRSKEQLQLQTLDRARQKFVDAVVRKTLAAERGEARLHALFDAWLVWSQEALVGGCIFVAASVELDDKPGVLRDALVKTQRDWLEFIANVAASAVAEGEFREDLDTEQLAQDLYGVMLARHHTTRLLHDPRSSERARRAFEALLSAARANS
jgi:AcrR family transcriptional regulator